MKVLGFLGQGGFGIVQKVVDDYGNYFAKKTFCINQPGVVDSGLAENIKRRFIREASVQANIKNPNIMPVCHQYLNEEPPAFTMPLAISTLAADRASGNLPNDVKSIFMDILAGLEGLHEIGITHRDLKPQNVLKVSDGQAERYVISDFGLISLKDTQVSVLTSTGMQMGSDYYTAPEIVADLRRASDRSDIYSVGCMLHDFYGLKARIPCNEIIESGNDFSDIIRICTRSNPDRRFQKVGDLREALSLVSANTNITVPGKVEDLANLLKGSAIIDFQEWNSILSHVESVDSLYDLSYLFSFFSVNRIREVNSCDAELAARLGEKYCHWASDVSHDFSDCDSIANRLEAFSENNDVHTVAEIALALLKLGVSHNRWYVERKFMSLCDISMNDAVAKRVALELRVLGSNACRNINHLQRSISVSYKNLHPEIVKTIDAMCFS